MFLTLGFKSVTMDDIATELGISKKTIYLHYANKNDLVEASAKKIFDTVTNGIDAICQIGHNPVEEIFIVRTFISNLFKSETASSFHQLQKFFPTVAACLRTMQFEKMHGNMLANIERGIKLGIYRPDINADFIGRMYFTGLNGIKDADVFPTDKYSYITLTDCFIEYHLRAIVTTTGLETLTKTIAEKKL